MPDEPNEPDPTEADKEPPATQEPSQPGSPDDHKIGPPPGKDPKPLDQPPKDTL